MIHVLGVTVCFCGSDLGGGREERKDGGGAGSRLA
jgi:hypothetical protein